MIRPLFRGPLKLAAKNQLDGSCEEGEIYNLDRSSPIPHPNVVDCVEHASALRMSLSRFLWDSGCVQSDWPGSIEQLHRHLAPCATALTDFGRAEHDETNLMAVLREYACTADFQKIYHNLIRHLRDRVVGADFVFEKVPVIRCILPGCKNLAPLRTADGTLVALHTDLLFRDPPGQINGWLALTSASGTAALRLGSLNLSLAILQQFFQGRRRLASIPDDARQRFFNFLTSDPQLLLEVLKDCTGFDLSMGQAAFFDMRRLHGTADNAESYTRVSMDFRLLPLDVYSTLERSGGKVPTYDGIPLLRGGFYEERSAAEL